MKGLIICAQTDTSFLHSRAKTSEPPASRLCGSVLGASGESGGGSRQETRLHVLLCPAGQPDRHAFTQKELLTATGGGLLPGVTEMFPSQLLVMVAQLRECTKTH